MKQEQMKAKASQNRIRIGWNNDRVSLVVDVAMHLEQCSQDSSARMLVLVFRKARSLRGTHPNPALHRCPSLPLEDSAHRPNIGCGCPVCPPRSCPLRLRLRLRPPPPLPLRIHNNLLELTSYLDNLPSKRSVILELISVSKRRALPIPEEGQRLRHIGVDDGGSTAVGEETSRGRGGEAQHVGEGAA